MSRHTPGEDRISTHGVDQSDWATRDADIGVPCGIHAHPNIPAPPAAPRTRSGHGSDASLNRYFPETRPVPDVQIAPGIDCSLREAAEAGIQAWPIITSTCPGPGVGGDDGIAVDSSNPVITIVRKVQISRRIDGNARR